LNQEQAIEYATCRACFRSGEIGVLDQRALSKVSIGSTMRIETVIERYEHAGDFKEY
jgi:hypothetical protein